MRYAVISDIHSNLEALEAVLADAEEQGIDQYLSTGDIVGYGADPVACLERVRGLDPLVVAGNHDWAVAGRLSLDFFNAYAKDAVVWTRERLTKDDLQWLHDLPLTARTEHITLVHATVANPEHFDYLLTAYDASLSLKALESPLCFVGHSHVPITFADNGALTFSFASRIELKGMLKAIVNAGSVGQPRDGNPHASYGVYDTDGHIIDVRRVEYDVSAAARKIAAAGLPSVLGERLWLGK
ncbi:MAG: metallophosphoesterase family protein [Planctomycetota bacterium]